MHDNPSTNPNRLSVKETQRISRDAIGNAMVIAYAYDIDNYLQEKIREPGMEYSPNNMSERDFDNWTKSITFSMCETNSRRAIEYLGKNHANNFNKLMLLDSSVNDSEHPFRNGSKRHVVFLAQDLSGRWYAGSPANYNPDDKIYPNPLTTLHESDNLSEVMRSIELSEGGKWPAPEFIETARCLKPKFFDLGNKHISLVTRIHLDRDKNTKGTKQKVSILT